MELMANYVDIMQLHWLVRVPGWCVLAHLTQLVTLPIKLNLFFSI